MNNLKGIGWKLKMHYLAAVQPNLYAPKPIVLSGYHEMHHRKLCLVFSPLWENSHHMIFCVCECSFILFVLLKKAFWLVLKPYSQDSCFSICTAIQLCLP